MSGSTTGARNRTWSYLRECGRQLQQDHGLQHIGDWHSHHRIGLDRPSGGDAATVRRTLEKNGFPRFLTCIANIRDADEAPPSLDSYDSVGEQSRCRGGNVVVIRAYLFEPGRVEPRRGRWSVLHGQSPVSAFAAQAGITGPWPPRGAPWQVVPVAARVGVRHAPPSAWYSTGWGRDFLLRLDTLGQQVYSNTLITVNADSGDLSYRFTAGHRHYGVAFPGGFPDRAAELVLPDGGREPVRADHRNHAADFFQELRRLTEEEATEDDSADRGACTISTGEEGTDAVDPEPAATTGTGETDSRALLSHPAVAPPD